MRRLLATGACNVDRSPEGPLSLLPVGAPALGAGVQVRILLAPLRRMRRAVQRARGGSAKASGEGGTPAAGIAPQAVVIKSRARRRCRTNAFSWSKMIAISPRS